MLSSVCVILCLMDMLINCFSLVKLPLSVLIYEGLTRKHRRVEKKVFFLSYNIVTSWYEFL